jgi:integrase
LLLVKTKKLILDGFKRITDAIEEVIQKEIFTLNGLARRINGGTSDSILDTFEVKITRLEEEGRIGSAVWYRCAKNSIEKYWKKDLKFSELTTDWLKEYQKHLEKEKKKETTISINLRALRAIVNDGMRKGIISQSQYPFREYEIPTGEGRKLALSVEQLFKVFDYPMMPQDEKWRDLWVFSFYCAGANLNDILRFKFLNIKGNVIEWYRQKTIKQGNKKRLLRAIITPEMKDIINRYGNTDHKPDNYIFPYLTNGLTPTRERQVIQQVTHNVNNKMKKIGDALGIEKLTSYAARHSFASISRRLKVDLFDISKSMGHATLKTTEIYLDSLDNDELSVNAAKLPRRK